MLDDAAFCGRQTKWKLISCILLIALLMGLFASGIVFELGDYFKLRPAIQAGWQAFPSDEDTQAVPCGNCMVSTAQNYVLLSDYQGNIRYSLPLLKEDYLLVGGEIALGYIPGEQGLTVFRETGFSELTVSGGVYGACVSPQGRIAVISGAPGYFTETILLDTDGTELFRTSSKGWATVRVMFLEDETLWALLISREGAWALAQYDRNGEQQRMIALDCTYAYDFCPAGEHILIWTDRYLYFYGDGEICWKEYLGHRQIRQILPLKDGFACLMEEAGRDRLCFYDFDGAERVNLILNQHPYDIAGSGEHVYLLFPEGCQIYDSYGVHLCDVREGARAASLCASDSGCYLIGIGERYLLCS